MDEPDRKDEQKACLRCGSCCRTSAPTLYAEDLPLMDRLVKSSFYTLRAGEMVHSSRLGESWALERDLVKVKHDADSGCVFLQDTTCTIWKQRPLQCRHYECWSGRHAGDLEDRPRLDRRDVWASDETALALIAEYDVKVPAARFGEILTAVLGGDRDAAGEAIALIDRDHRLRAGIADRHGFGPDDQPLLLGRPALHVARAQGLQVVLDDDGEPTLVPTRES